MLSIRTKERSERLATSLAALVRTITSRELEFIVIETGPGLSLMRCSTWDHIFKVFSVLYASCERLFVIVSPHENFVAESFKSGETLAPFLECGNESGETS